MFHKIEKGLEKGVIPHVERLKLSLSLLTLFSLALIGGCGGGGGDEGTNMGGQTREVTGVVTQGTARNITPRAYKKKVLASKAYKLIVPHSAFASGQAGTFKVTATGTDGSIHNIDTDPETFSFTLDLSVGNCYTMSFTEHMGPGMTDEFLDFMVLQCPGQAGILQDQFCISSGDSPVDLGDITVHSDHSFAMPMHNPLEVDGNGNGVPDFHTPNNSCGDVVSQDGHYYNDDPNHMGFHGGMGPGSGMGPH